jgi:pimeloyl-ACP methyl ester carboxylesterase
MAIAHIAVGDGPVRVIALHGWFGAADGWGELPARIDAARYSYAFLDYRGYGRRIEETGQYTLEEISTDARALADELGWDKYALLGHSMGGAAMLRTFADDPARVTAMVGISPVPASGVPLDEDGWALFGGAAQQDRNRYAIIDFTTGNVHSEEWVDELVAFSVANSRREAFGAYLKPWASADFVADLPPVDVPVRVIVGQRDPALGPDTMRATWLQQIPSCEMDVIAEAGHYPMYEAPEELVARIEKSFANLG